jgi:flagellar hook assembly protein FlgD/fibronectin type 3 domain-containing protein
VKRIPLLSGLAFIALVVLSLGALASDGILYANGSATPSPFSPNGSNSLRLDIDWGIDTAVRINPLTGTQTDNFEVRSEVAFTLSSQTIQTLTGLSVSVSAPTAQQTVYWDGRDSQGNLAPEGTYEWVLTGHLVDLSAPILSNVSPANGTNFPETTSVTVSGNVNDINAVVTVNGETAAVSQSTGNWSVVVPVIYGSNVLTIRAADPSGNVSTQTIGIAVGVALGYDPGLLTGELHDPSFERTQEKWTYTSTGSTYGSTLDPAFDGAKTFRSTSNTLTYSGRTLSTTNFVTGIVPGHSHRLEVGWYASGTEWADNRLEINIEWYDSSDSLVSTSAAADLTLAAQSTWELKIVTATAPASAAKAKILIRWRRTNSTTSGRQQSFDRVALLDLDQAPPTPNSPTLISPVNGAETQNIFPVYSWQHNDTDANPQAKYHIQVASDSAFTTILQEETVATSAASARPSTPLPAPSNAVFNWRVRTSSFLDNFSAFSAPGTFRLNNLVANPSFEVWGGPLVGDTAAFWNKLNSTTSDFVRQTGSPVLSGAKALLIKSPTTSFDRGVETRRENYVLSVTPDSGYRVGTWARKNNAQLTPADYSVRLQIDWLTSSDTLLTTSTYERSFNAFDAWEFFQSDTFIAPLSAANAQLRIQAKRSGGSALTNDEIYIDDAFVRGFFAAPVPPGVPANLDATPQAEKIAVTWDTATAGSRPLAQYRLYRGADPGDLAELAILPLSPRSYTDTAVAVGTIYFYAVRVEDAAGLLGDLSNIDSAAPLSYVPPGAPQNAAATSGIEQIALTWDTAIAGTNPLAQYRIYRGTDSATLSELSVRPLTPRSYTDTGVQVGTTYYYALRAEDTAGVLGDTSNIASAAPQSQPSADTKVIINEIMFDPIGSEPANEWVEVLNLSAETVSLAGWRLTDGEGTYTFPSGAGIGPGAFLVLGHSASAAGGQIDLVYGDSTAGTLSLANTGDQVILTDAAGNVADSVDYLASWAGEVGQSTDGNRSLERKSPGLPSNDFRTWGRSAIETGTPRAPNSVDTVPPTLVHGARPASLEGHDLVVHAYVSDATSPTILSHTTLYWRAAGTTPYTPVTMVKIQTAHSYVIPADSVPSSGVEYYIEAEDDANNLARVGTETAPFAVPRIADDRPRVRISEIMYDPGSLSDPQGEWVELVNLDDVPVDISGWTYTDSQSPAAQEGRFTIPQGTVIPAGGLFVLAHSASAAGGQWNLLYGDSTQGTINFLNSYAIISDQVILLDQAGVVVDEANYSSQWGANNGTNPADLTLERVNYDSSANLQTSWRVSSANGGSPGVTNDAGFATITFIENTMINPNLEQNAAIVIRLDQAATVSLYLEDTAGTRIRTLLDSATRMAGTETVIWDGRNTGGLIAWGVAQVVLVAADASGRVSVDRNDNRVGLVLYESWETPDEYDPYLNFRTTHTNLVTKPLYLVSRLEDTNGVVRRILFGGNIGEGPQAFVWDGRDDTGIIPDEQLYSYQTINQLPGRAIIVDEIPVVDGQVSPLTFAALRGEVAAIRGTSSINGRLDVLVSEMGETGLIPVRTLVTDSTVGAGEFVLVWDGRNDSGDLVPENPVTATDYYTIVLRLRSESTGKVATSFLSVRNKHSGSFSFDVLTRSVAVIVNDSELVNVIQDDVALGFGEAMPLGGATAYWVPIDTAPRGASLIRIEVLPRVGSSYVEDYEMGINEASVSASCDSLSILSGETIILSVMLAATDSITLIASRHDPIEDIYVPVSTIFSGYLDAGIHQFFWNGTNDSGWQAEVGLYRIAVQHRYADPENILNSILPYASTLVEIVE